MSRTQRLVLLAAAFAALVAVAAWYRSWGALALILVGGIGGVWYRMQVERSKATEKFFGDAGEDTRLTGLGPAPSEMPVDADARRGPPPTT
jgi:hypothetical protein